MSSVSCQLLHYSTRVDLPSLRGEAGASSDLICLVVEMDWLLATFLLRHYLAQVFEMAM